MEILVHEPWAEKPVLERLVQDNYREPVTRARNIVVKAGSDVLLTEEGTLDMVTMANLIEQMAHYIKQGYRVTFITSGAVAAGKESVGKERAEKIGSQGLATFGQSKLMEQYNILTRNYLGLDAGQILVEEAHFSGKRGEETKRSFDQVYSVGGLPVVNANDPVWVYELGELKKGSDNDQIAVWVYNLLNADLAIYLTSANGLMYNLGEKYERKIDLVLGISTNTYGLVKEINSRSGSFGMTSKLKRVRQLMRKNGQAVIVDGKERDVIHSILSGKNVGTYFTDNKKVQPYLGS